MAVVSQVLLRGPRGTPYEDGLFEFDCLYPPDYPFSPPLVTFKTTHGGRLRLNPVHVTFYLESNKGRRYKGTRSWFRSDPLLYPVHCPVHRVINAWD